MSAESQRNLAMIVWTHLCLPFGYIIKTLVIIGVFMILTMGLSACGPTSGRDFDASKLDQLTVGQTTINEAVSLLGEPQSISRQSEGTTVYMYSHTQMPGVSPLALVPVIGPLAAAGQQGSVQIKTATLTFNGAGVLSNWNSNYTQ